MIHTEAQYKRALKQIEVNERFFEEQRKKMTADGEPADDIQRYQDPSLSIIEDLKNDIDWYEQAKKGKFLPITNMTSLGRTLIALRISQGMTQDELAQKLDVAQTQVSRDEVNEYHGISLDRAQRILAVFGATLESKLKWNTSGDETSARGRKAA